MAVNLKQELDVLDYFGALAVWLCFFSIMFLISITCILYCCVSKNDDPTVFAKYNLGPRNKNAARINQYAAGGDAEKSQ